MGYTAAPTAYGGGDLFSMIDANRDGTISRNEFNQAFGGGAYGGGAQLPTTYGSVY